MIGQVFFIVYGCCLMPAWVVTYTWREHSDRAYNIRKKNGNDPNAVLFWMVMLTFASFIGLAIMVYDLRKSDYNTPRLQRVTRED